MPAGTRGRGLWLLLLVPAGCALPPYQGGLLYLPGREGGEVLRECREPLHPFFPRVHLGGGQLLSDWQPFSDGEVAYRRRLEIVALPHDEGVLLQVAVHRLRLGSSPFSHLHWVDDGGDRPWEDKVLEILGEQLGGRMLNHDPRR